MTDDRKPFEQGRETALIIEMLVSHLKSERSELAITYLELEKATGRPLAKIRGNIRTAIERVLKDHGVLFCVDRRLGYRVCPDEELPKYGKAHREKSRRVDKKIVRVLKIANPAKQSRHAHVQTTLELQMAELRLITSNARTASRIEQQIIAMPAPYPENALSDQAMIDAIKDALKAKVK